MSILSREQQLPLLAALVDGNSQRAACRMVDHSRVTVSRFALRMGTAAQHLHNALARDLSLSHVELDEVWSYVRKKQARVTPVEHAAGLGEAYTFVALAMPSRFVVTWKVGKRDDATADAFVEDLRARLVVMPALTSDGFAPYVPAIGKHMGPGVNYGQGVKHYTKSGRKDDDHRYEPPREPFLVKRAIFGAPNLDESTTAHMERNNGTMRHFIGRMRRLVLAFSKSPEHHRAAVALAYVYYNLCWIPRTTRITPAMGAGVTDHVWELAELLDALLEAEPCERPERQPIAIPTPTTTARPLPNGRGFLRVVPTGGGPSMPSPAPAPAPTPPAAPAPAPTTPAVDPRQLDLLSWKPPTPAAARPLPPPGTQLDLFDC